MGEKVTNLVDRLSEDPRDRKSALSVLPKGPVLKLLGNIHQRFTFSLPDVQKKNTLVIELLEQVGDEVVLPSTLEISDSAHVYFDDQGNQYISVHNTPSYYFRVGNSSNGEISGNAKERTLTLFKIKGFPDIENLSQHLRDTLRASIIPSISHNPTQTVDLSARAMQKQLAFHALNPLIQSLLGQR